MTPRPAPSALTERFEIRLTPETRQALEADAKRFGRTPTQSLRFAIDLYLAATPPPAPINENGGKSRG